MKADSQPSFQDGRDSFVGHSKRVSMHYSAVGELKEKRPISHGVIQVDLAENYARSPECLKERTVCYTAYRNGPFQGCNNGELNRKSFELVNNELCSHRTKCSQNVWTSLFWKSMTWSLIFSMCITSRTARHLKRSSALCLTVKSWTGTRTTSKPVTAKGLP